MAGFDRKNMGLTAKQTKAIQALLTEPKIAKAAKIAGVSERTLFRWLQSPDFAAAYQDARARLLEDALTLLQSAAADSAKLLHSVVKNDSEPTAARLQAAYKILSLSLKAREVLETEERLAALESLLQGEARGFTNYR